MAITTRAKTAAGRTVGAKLPVFTDTLAILVPATLLMTFAAKGLFSPSAIPILLTAPIWFLLTEDSGLYKLDGMKCTYSALGRLTIITLTGTAASILVLFVLGYTSIDLAPFRAFVLISLLARPAAWLTARDIALSSGLRTRVLVVGTDPIGQRLAATFMRQYGGSVEVVGFVDAQSGWNLLGLPVFAADRMCDVVNSYDVDHVALAFSEQPDAAFASTVRTCLERSNVAVSVVPRFYQASPRVDNVTEIRDIPLARLQGRRNLTGQLVAKRLFDVIVAGGALLCALPFMALSAVALLLDGQRQIIFRQTRIGKNGTPFTMYKFCSMRPPRPGEDVYSPDRQTRVGRILRKTSIDELPQLWNIVRGDMSLVGPRPEVEANVNALAEQIDCYGERHNMAGGLTGLSQVTGLRGNTSLVERSRLDNYYVNNWSFMLDIKIIARTFGAVLAQHQGFGGEAAFKDIVAEAAEYTSIEAIPVMAQEVA